MKTKRIFIVGVGFVMAFMLWTVLVRLVDVKAIGPMESSVGFATMNGYVHSLIGVNMPLYTITDWLGLVPIGIAFGFAMLGLTQWIKRRGILNVDRSILTLGGFYIIVIAVYVLFEYVVINYRPVLIDGYLEASYPSSTTLLVTCVMPTAIMEFDARIKNAVIKYFAVSLSFSFIAFMVIGRLVAGVHWFSDIIGGALLSTGLVIIYYAVSGHKNPLSRNKNSRLKE